MDVTEKFTKPTESESLTPKIYFEIKYFHLIIYIHLINLLIRVVIGCVIIIDTPY